LLLLARGSEPHTRASAEYTHTHARVGRKRERERERETERERERERERGRDSVRHRARVSSCRPHSPAQANAARRRAGRRRWRCPAPDGRIEVHLCVEALVPTRAFTPALRERARTGAVHRHGHAVLLLLAQAAPPIPWGRGGDTQEHRSVGGVQGGDDGVGEVTAQVLAREAHGSGARGTQALPPRVAGAVAECWWGPGARRRDGYYLLPRHAAGWLRWCRQLPQPGRRAHALRRVSTPRTGRRSTASQQQQQPAARQPEVLFRRALMVLFVVAERTGDSPTENKDCAGRICRVKVM
jgi:hypothetical protein